MRRAVVAVSMSLLAVACSPSSEDAASSAPDATTVVPEDYPDAQTRLLDRLARQPRPVPNSAVPPRHLDAEKFEIALIDRTRIVSGGQPADAIAAIDAPVFERVAGVDWLEDTEAVVVYEADTRARAYPVRIMNRHEIVNDNLGDRGVTVSYCPLCNSAIAYDRTVDGQLLDFGTSGALYQSALVMYDRQTESLWTHFDGRAVVGELVGAQLELVPVATVAWAEFRDRHPDGEVLSRDQGFGFEYGINPYGNYDQHERPAAGFFTGEVDPRLEPMSRVVGIVAGDEAVAVARSPLSEVGVLAVTVADEPLVVLWQRGMASSLQGSTVAGGDDIGAVGVFVAAIGAGPVDLVATPDGFVDRSTGSRFSVTGIAVDGPLEGQALAPRTHVDTFWFAWSTYHPETSVIVPTR